MLASESCLPVLYPLFKDLLYLQSCLRRITILTQKPTSAPRPRTISPGGMPALTLRERTLLGSICVPREQVNDYLWFILLDESLMRAFSPE